MTTLSPFCQRSAGGRFLFKISPTARTTRRFDARWTFSFRRQAHRHWRGADLLWSVGSFLAEMGAEIIGAVTTTKIAAARKISRRGGLDRGSRGFGAARRGLRPHSSRISMDDRPRSGWACRCFDWACRPSIVWAPPRRFLWDIAGRET